MSGAGVEGDMGLRYPGECPCTKMAFIPQLPHLQFNIQGKRI